MIDRREFVSGTALIVIAPTLQLLPTSPPEPLAQERPLVVKIDGWSLPDASNTSEEIWIRINRSWRISWR
jgi:hypothetical protein